MPSRIANITVDCADPWLLANFWSDVLGLPVHPDSEPSDDDVGIPLDGTGRELLFQRVPESKSVKNRLHLCLEPGQLREQEVDRLIERGAVLLADHRNPDGTGWAVLTDVEGNEFCVLRSAAERAAAHQPASA
ncbi:MAG: VOC family protein [Jatrophihabitantaceae bacterium]